MSSPTQAGDDGFKSLPSHHFQAAAEPSRPVARSEVLNPLFNIDVIADAGGR